MCPGGALPSDLKAFVNRIRSVTDRQLAVGFGISTPEQVQHTGTHIYTHIY